IKNTARVLKNRAAEGTLSLEQRGATLAELMAFMSGRTSRDAYQKGDVDGAIIGCGQCVGLIHEIKSVKEVIEDIIQDAQSILQKLNSMKAN
ncbi:MAG: nitronate monooxygenase, partial [Thermodesulfobacteriota bacterium]